MHSLVNIDPFLNVGWLDQIAKGEAAAKARRANTNNNKKSGDPEETECN